MRSKPSSGVVSPVRRRRRRSPSNDPLKKLTLQLSKSVVEAIKAVVNTGEAPSANVFVEDAVRHRLREWRRAKVYAAYEEASRDPGYISDLGGDMSAFDVTLSDGFAR